MSVLSKVMNEEWSMRFNCVEVGHFWTPHCSEASVDIWFTAFMESLKIYAPLYFASQIIFTRKMSADAFMESFKSIAQSSFFLSFNAFAVTSGFCALRRLTGDKFYYRIHAFFPAFIGAYASICIEPRRRRLPLAFYVANVASECLFRLAVDQNILTPIPKGEVLLFSASMSALLYLVKKQGFGNDPISLALRFYLGNAEANAQKYQMKRAEKLALTNGVTIGEHVKLTPEQKDYNANLLKKSLEEKARREAANNNPMSLIGFVQSLINSKHVSCTHKENCLHYSLNGFVKPFGMAIVGQTLLSCLKKWRQFSSSPVQTLMDNFTDSRNLKLGLFLGLFNGIYKATSCQMRRYSNGSEDWHSAAAALVAGPSMLFYPNSTIALYVFWKAVETLYIFGSKKGYYPDSVYTANVLYALAVTQVAFCVLLHPSKMRPSYMKFISQLTGNRFHIVNRLPLKMLSTEAVQGYEEYMPNSE